MMLDHIQNYEMSISKGQSGWTFRVSRLKTLNKNEYDTTLKRNTKTASGS